MVVVVVATTTTATTMDADTKTGRVISEKKVRGPKRMIVLLLLLLLLIFVKNLHTKSDHYQSNKRRGLIRRELQTDWVCLERRGR